MAFWQVPWLIVSAAGTPDGKSAPKQPVTRSMKVPKAEAIEALPRDEDGRITGACGLGAHLADGAIRKGGDDRLEDDGFGPMGFGADFDEIRISDGGAFGGPAVGRAAVGVTGQR